MGEMKLFIRDSEVPASAEDNSSFQTNRKAYDDNDKIR